MYIKKIEFTNFRGFQELSLDLPENLAVFIGVNGSGKTTILDGIYSLLKIVARNIMKAAQVYQYDYYVFNKDILDKKDIKITSTISKLAMTAITNNNNQLKNIDNDFKLDVILNSSISAQQSIYDIRDDSLKEYISSLFKDQYQENNRSFPMFIYYSANRISFDSPSNEYEIMESLGFGKQLDIYHEIFINQKSGNNNKFSFQSFVNWFEHQENQENEEIINQKDFNYRNNKLEIVRQALEKFISRLSKANFKSLRVTRNDNRLLSSLTIRKDQTTLTLSQLSDGEKMCLLIAADIARRLAITNPSLEISDVLKQGKGIILIDEIEAHLHPGWQREIIPALTQTFPSCQFILTTHSPQVLSKVKKENIFVLEDGKVYPANHTYGRDSNSILSETMGVPERPIEIKEKLDQCFDLIDDNKLEEAKAKLKTLSELLGQNDSEIVKANTTIDFIERIE